MVFRNIKLVGKKATLTSQEAFVYYRGKAKRRNKVLTSERKDYAKVLNAIYRKIREASLDYEGGVYAPQFFYLIPQPYPKKRFIKILHKGGEYKGTLNVHTKGRVYTLLFVNLLPKRADRMWDMSGAFFSGIRNAMTKKLRGENVRYLFSLATLKKVR